MSEVFVIRWEVDEVSKLTVKDRVSPIQHHSGLPWSLSARKHTADGPVDYFSLFLNCNDDSIYDYWSCEHTTKLVIVNRDDETKTVKHDLDAKFNKAADNLGKRDLVHFIDVMDTQKGFILDDKVLVEAHVTVKAVSGIKKVAQYDFSKEGVDTAALSIAGEKVHVSKGFLATESPFFADLFYKEKKEIEIEECVEEGNKENETKETSDKKASEAEIEVEEGDNKENETIEKSEEKKEIEVKEDENKENENKENETMEKSDEKKDQAEIEVKDDDNKENETVVKSDEKKSEAEIEFEEDANKENDTMENNDKEIEKKSQAEIELKDVSVQDFTELLLATYPSNKAITVESYKSILALAERFQVQRAMDKAEAYLIKTKKITVSAKLLLSEKYKLELLQLHCLHTLETPDAVKALEKTEEYKEFSDDFKVVLLTRIFALIK